MNSITSMASLVFFSGPNSVPFSANLSDILAYRQISNRINILICHSPSEQLIECERPLQNDKGGCFGYRLSGVRVHKTWDVKF